MSPICGCARFVEAMMPAHVRGVQENRRQEGRTRCAVLATRENKSRKPSTTEVCAHFRHQVLQDLAQPEDLTRRPPTAGPGEHIRDRLHTKEPPSAEALGGS